MFMSKYIEKVVYHPRTTTSLFICVYTQEQAGITPGNVCGYARKQAAIMPENKLRLRPGTSLASSRTRLLRQSRQLSPFRWHSPTPLWPSLPLAISRVPSITGLALRLESMLDVNTLAGTVTYQRGLAQSSALSYDPGN